MTARTTVTAAIATTAILAGAVPAIGQTAVPAQTIDINDRGYAPATAVAAPGQRVVWTNVGSAPHTVTADGGAFDSGTVQPRGTFEITAPAAEGSYAYDCTFHAYMRGTLEVRAGAPGPAPAPAPTTPGGGPGDGSGTARILRTSAPSTARVGGRLGIVVRFSASPRGGVVLERRAAGRFLAVRRAAVRNGRATLVYRPATAGRLVFRVRFRVASGVRYSRPIRVRVRPRVARAARPTPPRNRVREYWIKAESVRWNIVPNGMDALMGRRIPLEERIETAVVYRRYSRNWARPMRRTVNPTTASPGPLIEARVGDRVLVHFKNEDRHYGQRHSMHFHAFFYPPSSDGAFIPGVSGRGADVPVGGTFTYRLTAVPQSVGVWPYHDHSSTMMESIPRGLYGAIAILGKKERAPDRRFVVAFGHTRGYDTINGRAFIGNTPTMRANVGDLVEWDVIALGDAFHTFHVHGHRWLGDAGVPEDTRTIGPGGSFRVRFREDAPGTWYYHCHVESHQFNGMIGLYKVGNARTAPTRRDGVAVTG